MLWSNILGKFNKFKLIYLLSLLLFGCGQNSDYPEFDPNAPQLFEEIGEHSATGLGLAGQGDARRLAMAISPNNQLYIAWEHRDVGMFVSNGTIKIHYWNDEEWIDISPTLDDSLIENTTKAFILPQIGFAPDGTLYLTWLQNNSIYIKKWDGQVWQDVGVDSATNQGISGDANVFAPYSLVVVNNANIFVAWRELTPNGVRAYIKRWQGSVWEKLDEQSLLTTNYVSDGVDIRSIDLVVDSKGVLYALIT
ncbi:MAG TPA: hypothetical protein VLL52_25080 [Anaerolineae bacterium]|nr:hypothetical protein [Anaerolineae bacterium]